MLYNSAIKCNIYPQHSYFAGRSAARTDTDAGNLFTASELLIQEHVKKYKNGSAGLKNLIQQVLHRQQFDPAEVDHDIHERLMTSIEACDIEVIDLFGRRGLQPGCKIVQETSLEGFSRASVGRTIGGLQTLCLQGVQDLRGSSHFCV